MAKLVGRAVAFEVMDRDEGNSNSNLARHGG
jgi:hypothetical protein